jgi:hypothetical protein
LQSAATDYALRSPQIEVLGGGLQSFLNGYGEPIDVQHDQIDAQLMQSYVSSNSTFSVQIELLAKDDGLSLGIYDGSTLTPWSAELFPLTAGPGWFVVASFRLSPTRLVVNLFDANASLQGTTTALGGNRQAMGIYLQGPSGTFFSQDDRNPGGAAQVLFYKGAYARNYTAIYIAHESGARSSGADNDFDDAVMLLEKDVFVGAVEHTSWRALKQRFR